MRKTLTRKTKVDPYIRRYSLHYIQRFLNVMILLTSVAIGVILVMRNQNMNEQAAAPSETENR